jgi:hypothetical protein
MLAQVLTYGNNTLSCNLQLLGYYAGVRDTCFAESIHYGIDRHYPWQSRIRPWGHMTIMLGV